MPDTTLSGDMTEISLRYTMTGKALLSAYVDRRRVVAWEELAEDIARSPLFDVSNGPIPVQLCGYWKRRTWIDRNGRDRHADEFTIKSVLAVNGHTFYRSVDNDPEKELDFDLPF